jgi:hypothetical protein
MQLQAMYMYMSLLFLGVLPFVSAQIRLLHVRIINGIESVNSYDIQKAPRSNVTSLIGEGPMTKRWDGSPAYAEWQPAYHRGCTLNGMLQLDDMRAGQLLTPPRTRAHSDFLDVDGTLRISCFI